MAQVIEVHPDNPQFNYVVNVGTPEQMSNHITEMVKLFERIQDGRQVTVVRPDFVVLEIGTDDDSLSTRIIHYQIV